MLIPSTLVDFRTWFTGTRTLDLLMASCGALMIAIPIGVGKSRNLDATIEAAVERG